MMQIIDTHNHLYLPQFDDDRHEVVQRAIEAGVSHIMMPNIDSSSAGPMEEAAKQFPGICLPMMGLHPTSVKREYAEELAMVEGALKRQQYRGVGETGIDLYWDTTYVEEQRASFRRHLELAEEYKLPVIIHARNSLQMIIDELEAFGPARISGVFHAFPGNGDEAVRVTGMGFMIGIGGVVTFRNGEQSAAAQAAGLENIVLETDAPYLTPAPHRGKRNEPAYLTLIIARLAELLATTPDRVARETTDNAIRLFNL